MKHLYISLALLLVISFISAQNNVGIGTSDPQQSLEIEGNGNQYIRVHTLDVGASAAGLELIRASEFSGTDWKIVNQGGVLEFRDALDNFNTAGDLNAVITSSGNFGLGTASPLAHLDVSGSGDQRIRVHSTGFGGGDAGLDLIRGGEFDGTDWRILNDGGVFKIMDNLDNFTTPGDENLRITNSGNVGIGEQAPNSRLQVYGNSFINASSGGNMFRVGSSTGSYLAFDNNEIAGKNNSNGSSLLYLQYWGGNLSLCDNNDGKVGIGTSSPSAKLQITDGVDASLSAHGFLVMGALTGTNMVLDNNEIQARNNGAAASMFLQASGGDLLISPFETGQVGIGISSAANLPDPSYLLAVDGKAIMEEIRVEMSGSWPDYVFEDSYPLKSLDELEKHILEHKHLPGIPKGSLIAQEGFDLGDMQRRVVEKVEELTLYVIELNKGMEELKHENQLLKHEILLLRDTVKK